MCGPAGQRGANDVPNINDRNARFTRQLDRAYGGATAEIEATLERGAALPDR